MSMLQNKKIVEQDVRLSESSLWALQEQSYINRGLKAWEHDIPFYVSSNPFIAHQYADLICRYIMDLKRQDNTPNEPLTIIEIGGGSGKFTFHFLKEFKALLSSYQIDLDFKYIFTDIVQTNLDNVLNLDVFADYFQNNQLDCALFNARLDDDFTLCRASKRFSELCDGPCVVIANYAFDCLPQDGFKYADGKLKQMNLALSSRFKDLDKNNIRYVNDIILNFKDSSVSQNNYYDDPQLQQILDIYLKRLEKSEGEFLFPVGPINAFKRLIALIKKPCLFLVGDKGFSHGERTKYWNTRYRHTYDGCYSFSVNFDALGLWCEHRGGDALTSKNEQLFKVNLFLSQGSFNDKPLTRQYFNHYIDVHGPCDHCDLYEDTAVHGYRFGFTTLVGILKKSHWDPQVYFHMHERIMELIPNCDLLMLDELGMHLTKCVENLYPLKLESDAYVALSNVFSTLADYIHTEKFNKLAVKLVEQSATIHKHASSHSVMGVIHEEQANFPKAMESYKHALSLDKHDNLARKRLRVLSGKAYLNAIYPVSKALLIMSVLGVVVYWLSM